MEVTQFLSSRRNPQFHQQHLHRRDQGHLSRTSLPPQLTLRSLGKATDPLPATADARSCRERAPGRRQGRVSVRDLEYRLVNLTFLPLTIMAASHQSLLLPRLRGDLAAGSLHERRTERVGGVDTSQCQQGNQGRRQLYLSLPLNFCCTSALTIDRRQLEPQEATSTNSGNTPHSPPYVPPTTITALHCCSCVILTCEQQCERRTFLRLLGCRPSATP